MALLGSGLILAAPPAARAQDTIVLNGLHVFGGRDGSSPVGFVQASDGNFYGTTFSGGFGYDSLQDGSGDGTVYRLTPAGDFTTLYVFAGGNDGEQPRGLFQGGDGNLYGLTRGGGPGGYGTVFRLLATGELTTIYSFGSAAARATELLPARDGNFYGLTVGNGTTDQGEVFRLTPGGVYTTLYTFTGGDDGSLPNDLIQGGDGNFYGTADFGADNSGTIFRVTPAGQFTTLYTFTGGGDGSLPNGLTQGSDGNFYGTTGSGGSAYDGVVFRLTPAGVYTVLYTFTGDSNGKYPASGLVEGADGNFYGTTYGTTAPGDVDLRRVASLHRADNRPVADAIIAPPPVPATVFRITPQGAITTLYASSDTIGGFLLANDGNFYGASVYGGSGDGYVFEATVEHHPAFFTNQAALADDVYYLSFANGNFFGYYNFLPEPNYLYHLDLGPEYLIDAQDGKEGLYLYDFRSKGFFYTSPTFPFPYLYDFNLNSVVYYFPDPNNADRYTGDTVDGTRYFYDFATGTVVVK